MSTGSSRIPIDMTVAAAIAFAILCGLGAWQIQRLHWKEGLLAKIAALQSAPPRPINQALVGGPLGPEIDFTRVWADCPAIETSPFLKLFTVSKDGNPGFRVITACALSGGRYRSVLVDRGFVDQDRASALKPGARVLTTPIVGVLRKGDLKNFMTPENHPGQGLWYWRDIAAMARALNAPDPAPTFLMLERPAPITGPPTPAAVPVDIPNNHLGYALTWFGLAATLLGVYLASLWRRFQA